MHDLKCQRASGTSPLARFRYQSLQIAKPIKVHPGNIP